MHFSTKAIHQGQQFKGETGAVIAPLYFTSTFQYGNAEGFDYTRSGNPTFTNLESQLAAIENAQAATIFGSGMAAITAVISTLKNGDLVLAEENIYGCTYRIFAKVFEKFGVKIEYYDFSDPKNYENILQKKPVLVWIESPTNPLLKILDLTSIAEVAHKAGSQLVVDNTFASSYFQKPLDLKADISITSTTKYTNGHSDALGGVVCTNDENFHQKMIFAQKSLGLNPSPFDAWMIARGVKTMALRMEKHAENACIFAGFLGEQKWIKWVRYPFLPSHPQYEIAKKQMTGGSGIVTCEFAYDLETTIRFLQSLKLFTLAESLGGIESLVDHPASMTHASIPKQEREKVGITDSLVRFSLGIEDIHDLIEDIRQANKNCN